MKHFLALLLLFTSFAGFSQSITKVDSDAKAKLLAFIKKTKFEAQEGSTFNGLSHPGLKPTLSDLLNQAAKDFLTSLNKNPTEQQFQRNIGTGLARFNNYATELDSEDEDRICRYFEELMDCVGLQSSNGQLNTWRYGFDPTKKP